MLKTPLYDAVSQYVNRQSARFHMPGHKGKPCMGLPSDWFSWDVTELDVTDNLLAPEGCIKKAQALCAESYGACASFFTTGGATCGILAMFAAAVSRGARVLMDRACHLSAYNALSLCGGIPIYIRGGFHASLGIAMPPTLAEIQSAYEKNPDARTLFLTSPNAFGFCADLTAISAFCKEKGITLLVDEAHGAHFAAAPGCPRDAMTAGADMCVQSFHKTLPALTGAAVLHVGSPAFVTRADNALRLFQSTSPSYLIMASADAARAAAFAGQAVWAQLLSVIRSDAPSTLAATDDPYRLTAICDGDASFEILHTQNIVPEMVGTSVAVFIVTMQDTPIKLANLFSVLRTLPPPKAALSPPPYCPTRLSPAEVLEKEIVSVPLVAAEGRIAAKTIFRYPPATAILAPGEEITHDMCLYLSAHPDMPKKISVICE